MRLLILTLALAAMVASPGCGRRAPERGLFTGGRILNTADPAFTAYYRRYPDNDRAYVPPQAYAPLHPQPPQLQPQPLNPGDIPGLQPYYDNPTDNDSSYVPPKPRQKPFNPGSVPGLQPYYDNPTDNDSSYVPPQMPNPKPPKMQRYPDHDADYYPMIYDY